MSPSKGQVLGKLGQDALPGGITIGLYFGGQYAVTGSLLVAAETTGFVAGASAITVGLALAWTAPLGIVAIAVIFGSEITVNEIGKLADEISLFMSPGGLVAAPVSPFLSPTTGVNSDPMLFAKGVGPFVDLATSFADTSKLGRLGTVLGAATSYLGSRNDVLNLFHGYFPPNGSNDGGGAPTAMPNPPTLAIPGATTSPMPWEVSSPGGFGYENYTPGGGDTSFTSPGVGTTPDTEVSPYGPNTSVINIQDLGIPGYDNSSGDNSAGSSNGNGSSSSSSGDSGDNSGEPVDSGGSQNSSGSGSTDQGSGGGDQGTTNPGGGDINGGGSSDSSGGGDDGGDGGD